MPKMKRKKHCKVHINHKTYLKLLEQRMREDLSYSSQIEFRDIRYTEILTNYARNQRRMHWARLIFKYVFFITVCIAFAAIIGVSCYTIYKISNHIGKLQLEDVGVVLTALASIVSTIIAIPHTITKHLFPENGETAEDGLVSTMQRFDKNIDNETISSQNP